MILDIAGFLGDASIEAALAGIALSPVPGLRRSGACRYRTRLAHRAPLGLPVREAADAGVAAIFTGHAASPNSWPWRPITVSLSFLLGDMRPRVQLRISRAHP